MMFNEDKREPDNQQSNSAGGAAPASNWAQGSTTQNGSPESTVQRPLRKLRKPARAAVTPKAPKRQMSSIAFPYVDLDTVVALARAMNNVGGLALTRDQLAGALRQSATSGSFILKTSAARMFGLVEAAQNNKLQLTPIGFDIVGKDEGKERAARASAFLNVPLYKKAYEEFRGRPLPPRPLGLENAFVQFGVSAKQKDTARQIFEKSARQAGFFNVDPDRLIEPVSGAGVNGERAIPDVAAPSLVAFSAGGSDRGLDPLIQGLVDRLPEPGTKWELEKRARWLQTLAANFDMVYEADAPAAISVEVKKGDLFA